jgi:hypothetical protein
MMQIALYNMPCRTIEPQGLTSSLVYFHQTGMLKTCLIEAQGLTASTGANFN